MHLPKHRLKGQTVSGVWDHQGASIHSQERLRDQWSEETIQVQVEVSFSRRSQVIEPQGQTALAAGQVPCSASVGTIT